MMKLCLFLFVYILGLYVFLPHSKIYNPGVQYKEHSDKSTVVKAILDHEVNFEESYAAFEELMSTTYFDEVASYCTGNCDGVDKDYCDYKIFNDHCCCDHKYQETMKWFPHRCYVSSEPCHTYADNCEVYEITRECCCKIPLKKALKDFYSRQRVNLGMIGNELFIFMLLFIAVTQFVLLLRG